MDVSMCICVWCVREGMSIERARHCGGGGCVRCVDFFLLGTLLDDLLDDAIDFLRLLCGFETLQDALLLVIIRNRRGFTVVLIQTLLNRHGVVISALDQRLSSDLLTHPQCEFSKTVEMEVRWERREQVITSSLPGTLGGLYLM